MMRHEDYLLAELQHEAEVEEHELTQSEASLIRAHAIAVELCDELASVTQAMPYSEERSQLSDVWQECLEILFNVGSLARHL